MVNLVEKIIHEAISTNKYKIGNKEVIQSIKGSKLIILSSSINGFNNQKIIEQANSLNIPIHVYKGNSNQLGKICNKPFRVSSISIKTGEDKDIEQLTS
jgi:large subunit ribosomal protein L30e